MATEAQKASAKELVNERLTGTGPAGGVWPKLREENVKADSSNASIIRT